MALLAYQTIQPRKGALGNHFCQGDFGLGVSRKCTPMSAEAKASELPNIITILAEKSEHYGISKYLLSWENIIFSLLVIVIISALAYFSSRKAKLIPGRLQNAAEVLVGGLDDFVCSMLGKKGRKYVPFIGTLFIYILFMNLAGLIPFLKSSTASWSTTLPLALCVFFYVQYTAVKEMGVFGYVDHLAGQPRGMMAFTIILPIFMLFLHIISELVRPISLSLRLRGNIWGDEMLFALLAGMGLGGLPMLFFNTLIALLKAIVQAIVFCLLTTVYFSLALKHEEAH